MKLYYYKDEVGNFGDDLNPLVWYSLYPHAFSDQDDGRLAVGIGTLINDAVPDSREIFVLGSGVGYNKEAVTGDNWRFVFVRGPLSARALNLAASDFVTDPAILIGKMYKDLRGTKREKPISYMPHHTSCRNADWRELVEGCGIQYLNPAADVLETIHLIANSRLVIAEAMHAAIVADALRVPWVPVKAYASVLDFKWIDWCESVGLQYKPLDLPELWDCERYFSSIEVRKSNLKRLLISMGLGNDGWTPPIPGNNRAGVIDQVRSRLSRIEGSSELFLSTDTVHSEKLAEVVYRLDRFFDAYRPV